MRKRRKKKPKKIPKTPIKSESTIPVPTVPDAGNFTFSFRLIQTDHQKFSCENQPPSFYIHLLKGLSSLSKATVEPLRYARGRNKFNFHEIEWESGGYPQGFDHLPEQYRSYPHKQFSIKDPDNRGRVYGLLADTLFYVVWVDPAHQLFNHP